MVQPSKEIPIKSRKAGELEKSSLLLFVIMMSGNFLNYLFQIIMGKKLDVEDYGILTALLSMVSIITVFSAIIATISAKYTVQYILLEQCSKVRHLFFAMTKIVAACATVITIVGFVCAPWISTALKIGNIELVIFTIVTGAVSLFVSVGLGISQGLKRFLHYGIINLILIAGKLLFSLVLLAIGWHLFGPLSAIMLGVLISIGYGLFSFRDIMKKDESEQPFKFDWREFFRFSGKVLIIQLGISIIMNGDMLLVKYFFSKQDAGLYSSAMVIGKISMFAAMAIVAALFPMTIEHVAKRLEVKRLLYKSLIYSGGIAICSALVLTVFSKFVISFLYGPQYVSSSSLLLPISAFVIPVTLFIIMMNYQLATGQTRSLSLTLIGSIICSGVLVQFFHDSIAQMIYCVAAVLGIGVLIDILNVVLVKNPAAKENIGSVDEELFIDS